MPALTEISFATKLAAENQELRAQVNQLSAERQHLLESHNKIMALLGTHRADRILHDLRNVLNERELLKTLLGPV